MVELVEVKRKELLGNVVLQWSLVCSEQGMVELETVRTVRRTQGNVSALGFSEASEEVENVEDCSVDA